MPIWGDLDRESVEVWPCHWDTRLGEWILRFGGGLYGRSNSVQPFGSPGCPLSDAVSHCESAYRNEGLPPMFRIPDFPQHQELDAYLAKRGYQTTSNTGKVMVCNLVPLTEHERVRFDEDVSDPWISLYTRGSGRTEATSAVANGLYERVRHPRCFASLAEGNELGAVAMGTVWNGTLWLFGVTTHPDHRRKGYGRILCEAMLGWGRAQGAWRTALQVTPTNTGAIRLYEALGFQHAYGYHYRRLEA